VKCFYVFAIHRDFYFPSLLSLQIAGTAVESWIEVEKLTNILLPNVKSLRLKNTPLTSSMGQGEARYLAIARLEGLDYFNASVISNHERQEAERRYVSLMTTFLSKKEDPNDKERFLLEHPQYPRLSGKTQECGKKNKFESNKWSRYQLGCISMQRYYTVDGTI
jgi:hypothetical protein